LSIIIIAIQYPDSCTKQKLDILNSVHNGNVEDGQTLNLLKLETDILFPVDKWF